MFLKKYSSFKFGANVMESGFHMRDAFIHISNLAITSSVTSYCFFKIVHTIKKEEKKRGEPRDDPEHRGALHEH
jgi:hypothetical protein